MNTWAFDKHFNLNYILDNIKKQVEEYSENDKRLLKLCYTIEKPIIYEYSTITYKNMTYANCMENTILQFLKILLWNKDMDNYNLALIDKCFKKNECVNEKLYDIFSKIDKEKTVNFDYEWVKFIMELDKEKKYELIKLEVELNPTLCNLITFLKYITIDEINGIDDSEFLLNFVKKINEKFDVKVSSSLQTDKIILTTNKTYTMYLNHNKHAYFENSKLPGLSINILNNISNSTLKLSEYLRNYQYVTYSEINNFICLDYIENKDPFYNYYISKLEKNKIADSYNLFCRDKILYQINESIYLKLLSNHIACFLNLYTLSGDILWYNICKIKSNNFWNQVIDKNLCGDNWNLQNQNGFTVWNVAVEHIKSTYFWNQVIDKGLCGKNWNTQEKNGNTIWHNAVKFINFENFWNKVIDKDLCGGNWNLQNLHKYSVWHFAVKSIKSEYFWNQIIDKNFCGGNWNLQSNQLLLVWHLAVIYIESEYFWNQVIDKDLCGDNWNFQDNNNCTVLHTSVRHIESKCFWNQVIDKDLCGDNWNLQNNNKYTVWHNAIYNTNLVYFWNKVVEKKKFETLDKTLLNYFIQNFQLFEVPQMIKDTYREKSQESYNYSKKNLKFKSKYIKYKLKYLELKKNDN
jgi:hypothetical protein